MVVHTTIMASRPRHSEPLPRPGLPEPAQVFRHVPCLCGALMIATRVMTRLYNEELRHAGLETTQHSVLMLLKALGPMSLRDLGDRLAIDKTTVSRNAKVLVLNGWVRMERGEDGREKIVVMTPEGLRKLASARPYWERAQERIRAALPAGEFESMRGRLPEMAIAALAAA